MNPTPLENFLPYLNIQVDGVPRPFMMDALRQTCVEFCQQSLLFRETLAEYPLSADVNEYELEPSLCDSEVCRVLNVWVNGSLIPAVTVDTGIRLDTGSDADAPRAYYLLTPSVLVLTPTPSATGTLVVEIAYQPADDADEVPEPLYTRYRELIVRGAAARLLMMPNRPWTNVEHAALYRKLFWQALQTTARADHWDGFARPMQRPQGRFL